MMINTSNPNHNFSMEFSSLIDKALKDQASIEHMIATFAIAQQDMIVLRAQIIAKRTANGIVKAANLPPALS